MSDSQRDSGASRTFAEADRRFDCVGYGYRTVTVEQAVERAADGVWQVPDFQRKFVWRPSQVCDLADSLWQGYPIGSLLIWFNDTPGDISEGLVADGLQRLTSLCFLFGKVPPWLGCMKGEAHRNVPNRFDVYFDIEAERGPRFVTLGTRSAGMPRPGLQRLSTLLSSDWPHRQDDDWLRRLTAGLWEHGCGRRLDRGEIAKRLNRVAAIRGRQLLITELYHPDRGEVMEIFQRLNSRGMKFRRLLLKLLMEEIPSAIRGQRGYLLS